MAKGNTAPKVQTSGDRKNGKAVKKNPGPKQEEPRTSTDGEDKLHPCQWSYSQEL